MILKLQSDENSTIATEKDAINSPSGLRGPVEVSPSITAPNEEELQMIKIFEKYRVGIVMAIAYAATLGGMSTIVGTGTNLAFQGGFANLWPKAPTVSFAQWSLLGIPLSIIFILLVWIYFCFRFVGFSAESSKLFTNLTHSSTQVLQEEYDRLKPLNKSQKFIICNFLLLILLWFTRDFGFASGWGVWFKTKDFVGDGTVVIGLALFFFYFTTI